MVWNRLLLSIVLLHLGALALNAQVAESRYLVYLEDKTGTPHIASNPGTFLSPKAIARRANQGIAVDMRDLPVSPLYLDMIDAIPEVRIVYTSKWFNAVLIETDSQDALDAIAALGPVTGVEVSPTLPGNDTFEQRTAPVAFAKTGEEYGAALNQIEMINGLPLHADGFRGQGMLIAVMDGGFTSAMESLVLAPLLNSDRLVATYNFVEEHEDVFSRSTHGTMVLSTMAANMPDIMIGTAPDASYILCITEDVQVERRIEEVLWVIAAEYADSIGADVLNTSLGYTEFDVEDENYTTDDMDGNTTLITRGSDIAASRGMLVVSSAGNQGSSDWGLISAPADGDSVLAVGAVNAEGFVAGFSSRGPSADGRVKPNVMAQGAGAVFTDLGMGVQSGNGTSFSGPIIAGMSASLWQAFPDASAWQVHQAIEASAHLFQMPNDSMGYGIPDYGLASAILGTVSVSQHRASDVKLLEFYPNPYDGGAAYLKLPDLHQDGVLLQVYDLHGRRLKSAELQVAGSLIEVGNHISGLASGIYLLTVEADAYRAVARIVVP